MKLSTVMFWMVVWLPLMDVRAEAPRVGQLYFSINPRTQQEELTVKQGRGEGRSCEFRQWREIQPHEWMVLMVGVEAASAGLSTPIPVPGASGTATASQPAVKTDNQEADK